ncbi:MAG TPA: hypothetical protein VH350_19285 [Candidatus Sulfotelmatobacter sp.]|nr:hypothetical protein [Candidatus Sulfotelmatobacter sp.]
MGRAPIVDASPVSGPAKAILGDKRSSFAVPAKLGPKIVRTSVYVYLQLTDYSDCTCLQFSPAA